MDDLFLRLSQGELPMKSDFMNEYNQYPLIALPRVTGYADFL